MTKLFQMDNRGQIRVWVIEQTSENDILISYGVEHGAMITRAEYIEKGLAGRTLQQQVDSRINSRINDQLKKGYKRTKEAAVNRRGTNHLGFYKPMLAQRLEKVPVISYANAYVQHKYDGHRCLITKQNGETLAYSRQGKIISSIPHILDEINLPEGVTIDGELYIHGKSLQTITSYVKRKQEKSKDLHYFAYDAVMDVAYRDRYSFLITLLGKTVNSTVAPTLAVHSPEGVTRAFTESRARGYEGTIVRWGMEGYNPGKRDKHLIKVKKSFDAEVTVTDVLRAKDGTAVLECMTDTHVVFRVVAPGTVVEKVLVWQNKEEYIGKRLTIEYANLTADGVPFHPVALRWREDI